MSHSELEDGLHHFLPQLQEHSAGEQIMGLTLGGGSLSRTARYLQSIGEIDARHSTLQAKLTAAKAVLDGTLNQRHPQLQDEKRRSSAEQLDGTALIMARAPAYTPPAALRAPSVTTADGQSVSVYSPGRTDAQRKLLRLCGARKVDPQAAVFALSRLCLIDASLLGLNGYQVSQGCTSCLSEHQPGASLSLHPDPQSAREERDGQSLGEFVVRPNALQETLQRQQEQMQPQTRVQIKPQAFSLRSQSLREAMTQNMQRLYQHVQPDQPARHTGRRR